MTSERQDAFFVMILFFASFHTWKPKFPFLMLYKIIVLRKLGIEYDHYIPTNHTPSLVVSAQN